MKSSIWKDETEKIYPRARWTKWRSDPSRGCFVAGCSLNNHPGREKKVVHIMQTVDTCMQYWREKIIKIRGQSFSSRLFSLIILIPDCPPPSNAIAFWPIWTLLPSSEGILSDCELLSSEFALVYLQRRRTLWWCCVPRVYKYGNFPLEKYASEHKTSMQVCASTQMHQERKHVQKWTLKYAEEQSHWLARPSFCCLVTGRPSSS